MARACDICGKKTIKGNRVVRHGLAKAKGGIGLHTTGITRRDFIPNVQRLRVTENGGTVRRKVCTACLRSGKVTKA